MLQQDVDEVSSARAPLLKKRKCKEGQLPPGPTTCEEALNWVPPCLQQMHDIGLGLYNVDYRDRLQKALASGILLRTDFSGLGGPEEALDQILTGLGMSHELVTCQQGSLKWGVWANIKVTFRGGIHEVRQPRIRMDNSAFSCRDVSQGVLYELHFSGAGLHAFARLMKRCIPLFA